MAFLLAYFFLIWAVLRRVLWLTGSPTNPGIAPQVLGITSFRGAEVFARLLIGYRVAFVPYGYV